MADILLFPNIAFDESDVGPRPIVPVTGNRIGVVGEFMKGANGQFLLVDTPENLIKILGKDRRNGSLAMQTAMDQGARDFGVRRVMGAGVNGGAYLKFALSGSAGTSGRVFLLSTAAPVPLVGNEVTQKETVAKLIAAGISKSGVAGLVARAAGGNLLNIQSSVSDLPLMFRMVNPNDIRSTVGDSGLVLKYASNQQPVPANSIIRLSGGNLDLIVDYDQSAVKSNVTITVPAQNPSGNVSLVVGGVTKTTSYRATSSASVGFTTNPVQGDTLTVKIGNDQQVYTVPANPTPQSVIDGIVALFAASSSAEMDYVTVTRNNNNNNLVITAKDNVPFAQQAITLSKTGTAVWGNLSQPSIDPVLKTAKALADDLVRQFGAELDAKNVVLNVDSSNNLVVSAKDSMSVAVSVSATKTGTLTVGVDTAVLSPLTGLANSVNLHVLVGAEAGVTQDITTANSLLRDLSESASNRQLAVDVALDEQLNELSLVTRFAPSQSASLRGNESLLILSQVNSNNVLSVIGSGTAGELSVQYRPAVNGSSYVALANGAAQPYGGALQGPQKSVITFERKLFLRAVASASAALANGTVTLTFAAGEVKISGTTYPLATKTCVFTSVISTKIVAYVDNNGSILLKSATGAAANEVEVGSYLTSAVGSEGTFTSGQAVNGDILRVEAASEGFWGNDINCNLQYTANTKDVVLDVSYNNSQDPDNLDAQSLSFRLTDKDALAGVNGAYPEIIAAQNSNLVRVYYVGNTEEGKQAELHAVSKKLVGGHDGPPPRLEDYVRVINAMGLDPVNILIAPGQTHPTIRERLRLQAEQSNEITGLRIAVLSARKGLQPAAAAQETNGFDSAYAVMVGGWSTYTGRSDLEALSVPPDGFYAGHLAVTPVQASPAARTTSPSFRGIKAVDTVVGAQAFNEYTKARLEMIIADQATQVFHCLNGRSLAIDSAWQWISMRRIYNYIRSNAFKNLQFAKSEPNNEELRRSVANTVDQLLFNMRNKRQIDSYQPTKVDSENNPPNMVAQGFMRVDMFFTPLYPADFITVGLHRVVSVSLTVQTGQ